MGLDATFLSKRGEGARPRLRVSVRQGGAARTPIDARVDCDRRHAQGVARRTRRQRRRTCPGRRRHRLRQRNGPQPSPRTARLMTAPLQFHFDFSSPYGYLAAERIEALAAKHGRGVEWRPMLLGAVFKITGTQPLTFVPLKGDYTRARPAAYRPLSWHRVPDAVEVSDRHPGAGAHRRLAARRRRPTLRTARQGALSRVTSSHDRDISDPDIAAEVAAEAGVDRSAARAAVDDRDQGHAETRRRGGDRRGVFGSPFVVVDGEPFWGLDRFEPDRALACDGRVLTTWPNSCSIASPNRATRTSLH